MRSRGWGPWLRILFRKGYKMKKLFILSISIYIAFCPLITNCNFSYAENNNNSWTYIESQFDEADKKYTVE